MRSPARSVGMRAYLVTLVLSVLVPVSLFAAALLYYIWTVQRDQVRERHQAAVASLASLVAEEVNDAIGRLDVLAASPLLRTGDIDGFLTLARDNFLPRTPEWRNLLMVDVRSGEQVFNLRAPANGVLPRSGDRPHQRQAVTTRRPVVSDLFTGRTTGQPVVEVIVPVEVDGEVRYLLTAPLTRERLAQVLNRHVKREDVAAIVDREKRIITRTRDDAAYVGKLLVPALHERLIAEPSGIARFVAFEGDPVYSAWAPVGDTGWTVAYGLAAGPIEQALKRSLGLLAAMGLLTIGAGIAFAWLASRRISAAIDGAASAASFAAAGRLPDQAMSGIVELDRLHGSLREAAHRVALESAERADAERERDALLAAERAARTRAEAESRAKDEFLATLGHELRNPLAAIANAGRVLDRMTPAPAETRRMVDILQRQATQMGRLLDDLLDMARVTTGKLVLQRERVDLARVVRDTLAMLDASGRSTRHHVTRDLRRLDRGDATRLEQIVVNLVGNSLKFTPPGGRIEVYCGVQDDAAVLRVRDDGAGIDPALLPRVFDLFAQHDPTEDRTGGGLGIGLTLVRKVVELHGGSVSAASAGRGQGTEITARFPRMAAPSRVVAGGAAVHAARRPRDLLLVEDNADVRESLRAALGTEGHRVEVAASGHAAIAAALQRRPDVAIVDIGLPDMSGVEVARELRNRYGAAIRLVALSGFGAEVDDGGRFDVRLVKPVDGARLTALLDELFPMPQRAA